MYADLSLNSYRSSEYINVARKDQSVFFCMEEDFPLFHGQFYRWANCNLGDDYRSKLFNVQKSYSLLLLNSCQ